MHFVMTHYDSLILLSVLDLMECNSAKSIPLGSLAPSFSFLCKVYAKKRRTGDEASPPSHV